MARVVTGRFKHGMLPPVTPKPLRSICFALTVLLIAGCFSRQCPPVTSGSSYADHTFREIEIPAQEQLSSAYRCVEVPLVPDRATTVRVKFAKLKFHKGAVTEPIMVDACADRSAYAIELYPAGQTFLVPVDVQINLKTNLFTVEELENLQVKLVQENNLFQDIPH